MMTYKDAITVLEWQERELISNLLFAGTVGIELPNTSKVCEAYKVAIKAMKEQQKINKMNISLHGYSAVDLVAVAELMRQYDLTPEDIAKAKRVATAFVKGVEE